MVEEKSEAQLRNEEEVRRILKERGYSSATSKKQVAKTFGKNFPFKPIIVGLFIVALLIGGWIFLQNFPSDNEQIATTPEESIVTKSSQDLKEFQSCLGAIDNSEISLDDAEFWNKYISRYEQTISCYDQYPSVASSSEKSELQNKLTQFRENAEQAEANNEEYRANMARIDAELAQNLARIQEESDAWEEEFQKRVKEREVESAKLEAEYEKERAEREAKQAACDAFKAEYQDFDEYKAKNGNLDELWNNYQAAKEEFNHASSAHSGAVDYYTKRGGSTRDMEYWARMMEETLQIMNDASSAYNNEYSRLQNQYNAKYRETCV